MKIGMHNQENGSAAPLQFSKVLACDVSNLKKKILACHGKGLISLHNYST